MKIPKLNLSEWMSFTATILASVAVIISAWQAFMLRQQNRISVQPLIQIDIQKERIKTELAARPNLQPLTKTDDMVWLAVMNGGLGPAIFDSQSISSNGKVLDRDGLREFVLAFGHAIWFNYLPVSKQKPLKPGESIKILRIHSSYFNQPDKKRKEQYKNFLSLDFEIKYHDLYGKKKILKYKLGDIFTDLAKKNNWEKV